MKRMMIALALASMTLLPAAAQQNEKGDRQRPAPTETSEGKAESMASRLMLDDDTKAKFVPIYREYLGELAAIDSTTARPAKGAETTDEQLLESIEQNFDKRQKQLDTERKYYKQLKSVLNARQLRQIFGRNAKNNTSALRQQPNTIRRAEKFQTPKNGQIQLMPRGEAPAEPAE